MYVAVCLTELSVLKKSDQELVFLLSALGGQVADRKDFMK